MHISTAERQHIADCRKMVQDHLKNNDLIIVYGRNRKRPVLGEERPTKAEARRIRRILDVTGPISSRAYIEIATKDSFGSAEEKYRNVFRTVRSLWRYERSPRVGAAVCFKKDGKVMFGWSLCNTGSGDNFNKHKAVRNAIKNAKCRPVASSPIDDFLNPSTINLPHTIKPAFLAVIEKSDRAYKS